LLTQRPEAAANPTVMVTPERPYTTRLITRASGSREAASATSPQRQSDPWKVLSAQKTSNTHRASFNVAASGSGAALAIAAGTQSSRTTSSTEGAPSAPTAVAPATSGATSSLLTVLTGGTPDRSQARPAPVSSDMPQPLFQHQHSEQSSPTRSGEINASSYPSLNLGSGSGVEDTAADATPSAFRSMATERSQLSTARSHASSVAGRGSRFAPARSSENVQDVNVTPRTPPPARLERPPQHARPALYTPNTVTPPLARVPPLQHSLVRRLARVRPRQRHPAVLERPICDWPSTNRLRQAVAPVMPSIAAAGAGH
jgi:hypothetical protein